MKSINIQYFAILKDFSLKDSEHLKVNCSNYLELYELLQKKYQIDLPARIIKVAVNDEFCQMHDPILDNSKIVFIPPVAGG
jgi:molybdopterin synthase sulfur carrier subunit